MHKIVAALVVLILVSLLLLLSAQRATISAGLFQSTWSATRSTQEELYSSTPGSLMGNVDGTVRDIDTLNPIPNADVFLLDQDVKTSGTGDLIQTNKGTVSLPNVHLAVRRGTTNYLGEFLINLVPVPPPSKAYTVLITAPGYGYFIVDRAILLPGAVMSLNVDAKLSKDASLLFKSGDRDAPLRYRHEMQSPTFPRTIPSQPRSLDDRAVYTVFATREGLVDHTTANGHLIVPHDRFVALPSTRVLNENDHTFTFQVRLAFAGKSVDAPVWDVGPWNIADDYWNPSSIRRIWQDLAQGMPEAQAAFQNAYNDGKDQFGRKVTVPTAIDLADGTFWDDLGLVDNDWISVTYLWKPNVVVGDTVYATVDVPVRSVPGGNQIATEACGNVGIISSGPVGASYNQTFAVWWQVGWDDGKQGWSTENQIGKFMTPAMSAGTSPIDSTSYSRQLDGSNVLQSYFPLVSRNIRQVACPNPKNPF